MKLFPLPEKLVILTLILSLFLLAGCSRRPLVAIRIESAPRFTDDLDIDSLKKAVRDNLDYLRKKPPTETFSFADQSLPLHRLTYSLEHFLDILAGNPSPAELDQRVRQDYDIFQAAGSRGFNPGRRMLITGYYQPVFAGSLARRGPFLYPIYSVPDDLIRADSGTENGQFVRRLENGSQVPYWTRKEIETEDRVSGHELVWLKDPFDAFVLHVQGSGLIQLPDGTVQGVHYAAKNGHPYRSIGKYMVNTGRIPLETASLATIRDYINTHPQERNEILYQNPSFIFFDWADTHGAIGNLGKELTAGRSIAVDQNCFPAGGLAFLLTRKPSKMNGQQVTWSSMHRYVLVQDTGSAIRGPGRADLFWGTGSEAGSEAGKMREPGTLFFLLIKNDLFANVRKPSK